MTAPARAPGQRPDDALTVYRRIVCDARLAHGAFRLWHYLRDRKGKVSGKCYPDVRDIARDIHCKTHSLPRWTSRLESCGYLATEKRGQNHKLQFTILYGDHKGGLPEWATRGKAQPVSCRPKGQVATPKQATPRVAEMGDRSNTTEVIPKSKGEIAPPIFGPVPGKQYRREYQEMIRDAEAEIKKAKADPQLRERVLRKDVADLCKWLRDEAGQKPDKAEENLRHANANEADAANYVAGKFTPAGQAVIGAWQNRIAEIRDVMNGRVA